MREARQAEYRCLAAYVPEDEDFTRWLAAIGVPPGFPDSTHEFTEQKYWVEEQMRDLGIIDRIDEGHFHDYVMDYLEWLGDQR